MTPRIHQWTARAGWSGAAEMAAARTLIGIDPGNTGAFTVLRRGSLESPLWWTTWTTPAELIKAIESLETLRLTNKTAYLPGPIVVIVEEPFFASSPSGAIEQGWAAGHTATLVALAVGAADIVRAKSEAWQAPILGPVLTENGEPLTKRKRGEPKVKRAVGTEDKRSIRKRQALARLPPDVAASVTTKARREALADAHGIAQWGLIVGEGS